MRNRLQCGACSPLRSGPARLLVLVWVPVLLLLLWLGGCAVAPTGPSPGIDGPPLRVPAGLDQVPDAEPRVEPFRVGGPNKPYELLGRRYVPFTHERPFAERGLASWYGRKFHGRSTAMGEVYDMYAMTAAHPTLPLPSYVRVRNPANGREVVVRVNDRGPFHPGRIVDLSYVAALRLDLLRGVGPVELERLTPEDIRTGRWRGGEPSTRQPTASPSESAPDAAAGVGAAPKSLPPEGAARVSATEPAPVVVSGALPLPSAGSAPLPRSGAAESASEPVPIALATDPVALLRSVPIAVQARGFWLQLGAFRQREGAEDFQRNVAAEFGWLADRLVVFDDVSLFRLQAGPYPSRDDALGAAARIRNALHLVPVVVERQ